MRPRKHILIVSIALGLLTLLLTAVVLERWRRGSQIIDNTGSSEVAVDWVALAENSRTWLDDKSYDRLASVETSLALLPAKQERRLFARVALNCALGREASGTDDTYRLLTRAVAALADSSGAGDELLETDLALAFLRINLLRPAKLLLDVAPSGSRTPRIEAIHELLARVLDTSSQKQQLPIGDLASPCLTSPVLPTVLLELLTSDEARLSEDVDLLRKQIDDCPALTSFESALLPLVRSAEAVEPAPIEDADHDDADPDDAPVAEATPVTRAIASQLVAHLSAMTSTHDRVEIDAADPRVADIFKLSHRRLDENSEDPKVTITKTRHGFVAGWPFGALWLAQQGDDWIDLDVFEPNVSEVDVTGDAEPEVLAKAVQGSGRFLSAVLLDQMARRIIWTTGEELHHGRLSLANLDDDPQLEVVTMESGDYLFRECNQCISRVIASIHDLDVDGGRFTKVVSGTSNGEFALTDGGGGAYGISAEMWLQGQASVAATLVQWEAETDRQLADADLEVFRVFYEHYGNLIAAKRFGEAASLMKRIREAINRRSPSLEWRDKAIFAALAEASALATDGQYEHASTVLATVDSNALKKTDSLFLEYSRIRALMQLNYAQLGDALRTIAEVPAEGQPLLNSALAAYYRSVGRLDLSYRAAVTAVAPNIPSGRSLAMATAGIAALDLGRREEAVDWLTRAVIGARAAGSDSATAAFVAAAALALRFDATREAVALLNEAVIGLDPESWTRMSPSVFESFALLLEKLNRHDEAEAMWQRAATATRPGDVAAVNAEAGLSRFLWARGRQTEARRHAERAFTAVTSSRLTIGDELDKLSFITSRQSVASWYFDLLVQSNASAEEILKAVEGWRLRVVLDEIEAGTSKLASKLDSEDVVETLKRSLGQREAFVSYVYTGSRTFAIVVKGDDRRGSVVPLNVTTQSTAALMKTIQNSVSTSDPMSLAAIRGDRVQTSLTSALREAGRLFVEPLGLGGFRTVLVSADEALFGMPWAAVMPRDDQAIVDNQSWVVIPSLTLSFAARRVQTKNQAQLLVGVGAEVSESEIKALGDPSLPVRTLAPLSGVLTEIRAVSEALLHRNVRFLVDAKTIAAGVAPAGAVVAEPKVFLKLANASKIIHVAAHGLFLPGSPMDSVIFLSPAEGGRTVRARDFVSQDLSGVSLVVLASCQSGDARTLSAAEPLGFLRGLLRSGARDVLLAQWQVDDRSSPELFSELYSRFDSQGTAGSLRAAQIEIRKRKSHPFYWAGLTLYRGRWSQVQ